MTKKQKFLLVIFLVVTALVLVLLFISKNDLTSLEAPIRDLPLTKTVTTRVKRDFIGPDRRPIQAPRDAVTTVNRPSPEWKKKLEESLRHQSKSVKDIKIKTERSLIWLRDENDLAVESVVISLTNQRDEESSFRALIDSQTGKVLETWDQTISDPLNPREEFGIKLDPRYTD